ncbi:MAG: hypothetical protein WBZ15_11645 [Mycobacterium sp.]|uniref:hypothetical protein n=1 Tax=Mycobacterium sp. TaxID=1785 RepID=UPI003C5B41CA
MTTKPPDPKPLPALAIVATVLVLASAFTAVFVLGRTKHDPSQSKESATDFAGTAIDVYCPDGHPDDPG